MRMLKRLVSILSKIKLGLIGKDIQKSKSPEIYKSLLSIPHSYDLLDFGEPQEIPDSKELSKTYFGLNITAPYKQHFLDENIIFESTEIKKLQVINCMKFLESSVVATNTDYLAIKELFPCYHNDQEIFLLGDGAMAKVFSLYFQTQNLDFVQLSRKLGNLEINSIQNYSETNTLLVINCCSRGFEFNLSLDGKSGLFWDLNYSNPVTQDYLSKSYNFKYVDGLEFLESQARWAIKFWGLPSL